CWPRRVKPTASGTRMPCQSSQSWVAFMAHLLGNGWSAHATDKLPPGGVPVNQLAWNTMAGGIVELLGFRRTPCLAQKRPEAGLPPGHPALSPHADQQIPLCFASALERVAEALQVEEEVAHAEDDEGLLVPGPEAPAEDADHAVRGPEL